MIDLAKNNLPPASERDYNPNGRFIGEKGGRFDIVKHRKTLLSSFQRHARKNGIRGGVGEAIDYLNKGSPNDAEITHIIKTAKSALGKDFDSPTPNATPKPQPPINNKPPAKIEQIVPPKNAPLPKVETPAPTPKKKVNTQSKLETVQEKEIPKIITSEPKPVVQEINAQKPENQEYMTFKKGDVCPMNGKKIGKAINLSPEGHILSNYLHKPLKVLMRGKIKNLPNATSPISNEDFKKAIDNLGILYTPPYNAYVKAGVAGKGSTIIEKGVRYPSGKGFSEVNDPQFNQILYNQLVKHVANNGLKLNTISIFPKYDEGGSLGAFLGSASYSKLLMSEKYIGNIAGAVGLNFYGNSNEIMTSQKKQFDRYNDLKKKGVRSDRAWVFDVEYDPHDKSHDQYYMEPIKDMKKVMELAPSHNAADLGKTKEEVVTALISHELHHAIYHQLSLKSDWKEALLKHKVTMEDRCKVSEYAATGDRGELFSEVGSSLDIGLKVPDNLKAAYEEVMKASKTKNSLNNIVEV